MSKDDMDIDDDFLLDDEKTKKLRSFLDSGGVSGDDDGDDDNEQAILFSDDFDDDLDDDDYADDYEAEEDEGATTAASASKRKNHKSSKNHHEEDDGFDDDDEDDGFDDDDDEVDGFDDDDEDDYDTGNNKDALKELGFSEDDEDGQFNEDDIDEDFEFRNALREATNFKVKKQKGKTDSTKKKKGGLAMLRRKIRRTEVPPEVKLLLSEANEAFVRNDLQVALNTFLEVVKLDKNNFSAYKTLGEIYRLQGNYNKCSNFWLLAAHIHPWDYEFWRTLAELSVELGHKRQAMYCYTKAIAASHHKDYDAIFARACLYRERGQYKRASDSLQKLRQILPQEPKIQRELAKVYVDENRINDAITMYNKILEENMKYRKLREKGEKPKLETITFDWSELNILLELYGKKAAWSLGIKTLRQVSRWIQMRENQTFWDDNLTADIEFDDRRMEYPKYHSLPNSEKRKDNSLPIDIRVQLGSFRLNSKNTKEALIHFEYVLSQPVEETSDLYLKIGNELELFGLYEEALKYFYELTAVEENNTFELILSIAKCLTETDEFESAKEAYSRLLEHEPDNVEIKVALAEVCFYLGETAATKRLYKEAKQLRTREKAKSARKNLLKDIELFDQDSGFELSEDEDEDEPLNKDHQSLIVEYPNNKKHPKKKKFLQLTVDELASMELKSTTRIREQYLRSVRLLDRMENSNGLQMTDKSSIASMWIDLVSELIEIFSTYRCFFSSDRAKKFNSGLRRRTQKLSIDQKLSRIPYLQDEMILSKEMDSGKIPVPDDEFKGLTFNEWYDLFMKYSLMIAEYEDNVDDAISIQEIARHVNVFKKRELSTNLVGLSVGLKSSDSTVIMNQMRNIMNDYQFSIEVLKTFIAACQPSQKLYGIYADAPNQKYILRQMKAFDSLRGKEVSGMASVTSTNIDKSKDHPLLNYIYSTFLFFNKSFNPAVTYLNKLYKDFSKDPSIVFLMALSNLHRSMQRKSINRNFQIIQGLTLLLEYSNLKNTQNDKLDLIEVNYNMGRAFNLLGLNTLAIHFYEKVLSIKIDEPKYDLRMEAAYNMCLIYNFNGNHLLAEKIMNEYLVI